MKKNLLSLLVSFAAASLITPLTLAVSTLVVQPVQTSPGNVPSNAIAVPLLQLQLTAQESDITLGAIGVTRTGLSESKNIERLRAYVGNTSSIPATLQTDDTAQIKFRDLILIPKGGTVTLVVQANLAHMTSGRTIGLDLNYVTSSAQNVRVLPSAATNTTTSGTNTSAALLEFQSVYTQSNARAGYNSRIGQFRLTNPSRKDVYLQKLVLNNEGTANLNTSIANGTIYSGAQSYIAAPATIDRDTITFFFLTSNTPSGYKIPAGSTISFQVWADILLTSQRDETIILDLKNQEDLVSNAPSLAPRQASSGRVNLSNNRSYTLRRATPRYSGRTTPYNRASYSDVSSRLIQIPGRTYNSSNRFRRNYSSYRSSASSRSYSRTLPRSSRNPAPGTKDVIFYTGSVRASGLPMSAETFRAYIDNGSFAFDKDGNNQNNDIRDFEETFENLTLYVNDEYQDRTSSIGYENGRMFYAFDTQDVVFTGTNSILITGRVSNDAQTGDKLKLSVSRQDSFQNTEYIRY